MSTTPDTHASSEALTAAIAPFADELITPALVIDLDAVAHNLAAMSERLAAHGGVERWRPHLKTSKQAVVFAAMIDAKLRCFKVATCDELELLLRTAQTHSPREVDVLFAYPPQRSALAAVLALAEAHPHARIEVLADSPAHLEALARWVGELAPDRAAPLEVMLDVDLGMHRTGSPPGAWRELEALPSRVRLAGLHGYDGHLWWGQRDEAMLGYDALCELAPAVAERLGVDLPGLELVTSGTRSFSHALDHAGLREGPWRHRVSPGTLVLSDLRSREIALELGLRQAAFVAARVVSTGPGRVTLDAGSKAICPDVPPPSCAVLDHAELEPQRPTEEHLPCAVEAGAEGSAPGLGELVWLVPAHVCTTVNLHREAVWLREGRFVGVGPVGASGHRPRFGAGDRG